MNNPIPTDAGEPVPDSAAAADPSLDGLLPLYTPAVAAQLLGVRESWLRRRAAARAVACTFVGRHLRFSPADVVAIAAAGAQPAQRPTSPRGTAAPRRSRSGRRR